MTSIPPGWTSTTLGALGKYLNGRGFKKSEWRESGRPIIRIQNLTGSGEDFNYYQGEVEESYVARPGDLLVSWAATLGAYIWVGPEAVVNQHIFKVESKIDRKLHKYLLDHKLDELRRQTHGSGMVHITRSRFDAVPVAIPESVEQQRRIVDVLEDHLSRLDAAGNMIASSLGRLARLRQSILARALEIAASTGVGGVHTIGDIASVGTGATPLKSRRDYYDGGAIPWLTSADIARGIIDQPTQFITPAALAGTNVKLFPPGTLLVAMYGEGKTRGTVGELAIEATTNQACAAIQLHDSDPSHRAWVRLALEANYWQMRRLASGGVQPNLNLGLVRQIRIPLPDASIRASLLRAREVAEQGRRQLESELRLVKRRESTLRRALLDAAFSGRLTGRTTDMEIVEEIAGV